MSVEAVIPAPVVNLPDAAPAPVVQAAPDVAPIVVPNDQISTGPKIWPWILAAVVIGGAIYFAYKKTKTE